MYLSVNCGVLRKFCIQHKLKSSNFSRSHVPLRYSLLLKSCSTQKDFLTHFIFLPPKRNVESCLHSIRCFTGHCHPPCGDPQNCHAFNQCTDGCCHEEWFCSRFCHHIWILLHWKLFHFGLHRWLLYDGWVCPWRMLRFLELLLHHVHLLRFHHNQWNHIDRVYHLQQWWLQWHRN